MPGRRFRKRMLPTKKRCPRCGRVLPAEAFNLVRGGRELAGWCRVCNHRYYLDRKEAGFGRKNPSGRRIAHGGYTDAVGRVYRPRIGKGRHPRVPFFRAGYAGCMECTVHLLAGMPVCYIYRQQGGRQPSRPMAERKNHEHAVRHHPQEPRPQLGD